MTYAAPTWEEIRAQCAHESLLLVEGGYERTWHWRPTEDGRFIAVFHGLEDFSDDGDGNYVLRCSNCLAEFPTPDDWEWD